MLGTNFIFLLSSFSSKIWSSDVCAIVPRVPISQKKRLKVSSLMCFSIDVQRQCLTLHLRRFLRRLERHWGRKPDRLVASGGSNFIRFSPIDSILNLEDSHGSILHLSRRDRRHRRLVSPSSSPSSVPSVPLWSHLFDSLQKLPWGRCTCWTASSASTATCNVFRHPITWPLARVLIIYSLHRYGVFLD